MEAWIQQLVAWMVLHPTLCFISVALIAFGESLILVGVILPGALFMFLLGALAANADINLLGLCLSGSLGAFLGDILSFWIGRRLKHRMRTMWPFSRYPRVLEHTEHFFARHGGKSVFLARFVGLIRPILPAVAGMLHMPWTRFLPIAALACLLWSPAYLLPGALFGASLALASEIGLRLAVLLGGIGALLFVLVWMIRNINRLVQRYRLRWASALLGYARRHRRIRPFLLSLLDESIPERLFLGLLSTTVLLLFWLWHSYAGQHPEPGMGMRAYELLQWLRSDWSDVFFVHMLSLAEPWIWLSWGGLVSLWLGWRGRRLGALNWLAALGFVLLFLLFGHQIPETVPAQSWLAGSVVMASPLPAVVLLGISSSMIALYLPAAWRWLPYAASAVLMVLICLALLTLGVVWWGDLWVELGLGMLWVAFLIIAYQHHSRDCLPRSFLLAGAMGLLLSVFLPWWGNVSHQLHPLPPAPVVLNTAQWQHQQHPFWLQERRNVLGQVQDHLSLRWLASKDRIRQTLQQHGWQAAVPFFRLGWLGWLTENTEPMQLAMLPHALEGRSEAMIWIRPIPQQSGLYQVLRLWDSRTQWQQQTVYLGHTTDYRIERPYGLLSRPHALNHDSTALARLLAEMSSDWRVCKRSEKQLLLQQKSQNCPVTPQLTP